MELRININNQLFLRLQFDKTKYILIDEISLLDMSHFHLLMLLKVKS